MKLVKSKQPLAVLLFAVAFALPSIAFSQPICEGLSEIVTAMDDRSTRDDLEFFTVPGAKCEFDDDRDTFQCIWQKPSAAQGQANEWLNTTIYPAMKKLTGAAQKCIKQQAIPFKWGPFKKKKHHSGGLLAYFSQRKDDGSRPLTMSVCFGYDGDDVGAGIVLTVAESRKGKSKCRWW